MTKGYRMTKDLGLKTSDLGLTSDIGLRTVVEVGSLASGVGWLVTSRLKS